MTERKNMDNGTPVTRGKSTAAIGGVLIAIIGLAAVPRVLAQSPAMVAKVRAEWALTDEQLAAKRKRAHELELNWARGLWVVRDPLFFSSYKSVDDYLSGRKIPDGAPLTPEYRKKALALLAEGTKDRAAVDTGAFTQHLMTMGASFNMDPAFVPYKPFDVVCPLYGYPLMLTAPQPIKWEFASTKIFQLFNGDGGVARMIKANVSDYGFKGGFRFPADTVADGLGWGYATWDDDVLTINVSYIGWWYEQESGYVLEIGVPHSDKLTTVEKWRQTGPDTLEMELTMKDPVALTRPWTVKKIYDRTMGDVKFLEVRDRQCH
jgi:hypothetical protein